MGQTFEVALAACLTIDEVASAQNERRPELAALSRERPELYKQIGEIIAAKRAELPAIRAAAPPAASAQARRQRTKRAPPARVLNWSVA